MFRWLLPGSYRGEVNHQENTRLGRVWLHTERLHTESVITVCISLVRQVEKLHKLGYLHGDIKASNVIITSDDEAFLIDFDPVTICLILARRYTVLGDSESEKKAAARSKEYIEEVSRLVPNIYRNNIPITS